MGDDGFDFQQGERREKRNFEIPPWEREAFEQLKSRGVETPSPSEHEQQQGLEVPPALGPKDVDWVEAVTEVQQRDTDSVDDAVMKAMLASLAAEDRLESSGVWRVTAASGLILGGVGLMLLVWGVVALIGASKTGKVGFVGGLALTVVGGSFIATSAYLLVKTLRDRGVL